MKEDRRTYTDGEREIKEGFHVREIDEIEREFAKRWRKLLLVSFYSVFVYNYHVRVFEKFAREFDLRES